MSAEISNLINGFQDFKKKYYHSNNEFFDKLILFGQKPKIMIIACSDSRIDPAVIFNVEPGELFVVRNVANLVPPFEINGNYHGTSAALEFAVKFLQVEHIILLGHSQCGGIRALIEGEKTFFGEKNFISQWMQIAKPALDKVLVENPNLSFNQKSTLCEQYSLINSLKNLETFSWIKEKLENGNLKIYAWYFDLISGDIKNYDQKTQSWKIT